MKQLFPSVIALQLSKVPTNKEFHRQSASFLTITLFPSLLNSVLRKHISSLMHWRLERCQPLSVTMGNMLCKKLPVIWYAVLFAPSGRTGSIIVSTSLSAFLFFCPHLFLCINDYMASQEERWKNGLTRTIASKQNTLNSNKDLNTDKNEFTYLIISCYQWTCESNVPVRCIPNLSQQMSL